ncbi:bark storage protein A-like [Cornus florida]|uniref:bark storage protein A-like n=1 Tax=Cornus florida TaxID=4283 RepID=UPI00289C232B|nr:bark storage protein A-like [Cornus florida]
MAVPSDGWKLRPIRAVDLEVMVTLLVLLGMSNVKQSMQLRSNHPLHGLVDRVNENAYIGLVMAFSTELNVLQSSALFLPRSDVPWLDLAGMRFNIGSIGGVDVIYVMAGEQTLNAGITVQILVDVFNIRGIVHYGIAGSANDSLSIGSVAILKYVAFTGSWKWKNHQSEKGDLTELKFGAYNFPTKGDNLLAKIEFTAEELYSIGQPMEELFWLPVDQEWFTVASQLVDLKLQQCVNETYCLPETPKVVSGLRGSTADIYLKNAAYREFLFNEFNISTVDEESSAIVMTCLTNGVPCAVFRAISDLAGASAISSSESVTSLAAMNALSVAVEFIALIGTANPISTTRTAA